MATNGYMNLEIENREIERKKWRRRGQEREQVLEFYLASGIEHGSITVQ